MNVCTPIRTRVNSELGISFLQWPQLFHFMKHVALILFAQDRLVREDVYGIDIPLFNLLLSAYRLNAGM